MPGSMHTTRGLRRAALLLGCVCIPITLWAQTSTHAPVPAQLLSAKTAFLGNAGGVEDTYNRQVYDDLYRLLSASQRFQLKASPAEAELLLECSLAIVPGQVINGSSANSGYLRLAVLDTKTHALLWAFTQELPGAFRQKTFQKNLDQTAAKIVTDLQQIGNEAPPQNGSNTP